MGAHLCAMGADLAEPNMSAPKIRDTPEGSPRCRRRTSRISESLASPLGIPAGLGQSRRFAHAYGYGCLTSVSGLRADARRGWVGPRGDIHLTAGGTCLSNSNTLPSAAELAGRP